MTLIPAIEVPTLVELANRIQPLARFKIEKNTLVEDEEGDLYYIKTPDLVLVGVNREPFAERPANDLTELAKIETYHTHSSMLNASVAEVLAQIPSEYVDRTDAFEVTHPFPCPIVSEGMESYHKTTTILYQRTE